MRGSGGWYLHEIALWLHAGSPLRQAFRNRLKCHSLQSNRHGFRNRLRCHSLQSIILSIITFTYCSKLNHLNRRTLVTLNLLQLLSSLLLSTTSNSRPDTTSNINLLYSTLSNSNMVFVASRSPPFTCTDR